MKFTLDTEFNGFGGKLLSLALVPWDDDAPSFYIRVPDVLGVELEPWVEANVWPHMDSHRADHFADVPLGGWAERIARYLGGFSHVPYIIADWPDDIRYFCQAIITGPGEMVPIPRLQFDVVRVDPWEAGTPPTGAVRHNAWWGAVVLRDHLKAFSA
jgi:hypothetical protein